MLQKTSSSTLVRGLTGMFAAEGADVPTLLAAAGIAPQRLQDPAARFGADEVSRLWEHAVARTGKPALGLDRALALEHVNFDLLAFAMLASPDLRSGLVAFARYLALISDAATFAVEPAEDGRAWLMLGHTGNSRPVPRQRFAYGMLALLTLCQWLTRRSVEPLQIEFKFPQPPEVAAYHGAFRCPLRFGAPENRMLLAPGDLDAPIPSRNPALLEMHEKVMRERLAALGHDTTSSRVSEEIFRRLPAGEPLREDVAAALGLADRTLQRRLQAERTSFQQLLDEARRELARKYLADPRYSLAEVGDRLGFAEASNFFRACRRWFGVPPGQYRERLMEEASSA